MMLLKTIYIEGRSIGGSDTATHFFQNLASYLRLTGWFSILKRTTCNLSYDN